MMDGMVPLLFAEINFLVENLRFVECKLCAIFGNNGSRDSESCKQLSQVLNGRCAVIDDVGRTFSHLE